MRKRQTRWAVLCVAALTALPFKAIGAIQYRVNGGAAQNLPANNRINVGSISGTNTLHIFDNTGFDENIPAIVVEGSANSGALLQVLVAHSSATFPATPTTLVNQGGTNFAGLAFDTSTTTSLQNSSRVVASVAGNITGPITGGQLFRIDAVGSILEAADLTATSSNDASFSAVEVIQVGNLLAGDVVASVGSIVRVRVGPSLSAQGITGDIRATGDLAVIKSVWSTGPIGSPTDSVNIFANDGIGQVRAVSESAPNTLIAADIYADIRANEGLAHFYQQHEAVPHPTQLRRLNLVETRGNVFGAISADSIAVAITLGSGFNLQHAGIYAMPTAGECTGGDILADINIAQVCKGNIVGRTIQGNITIGRLLDGAILAWDLDAQHVPAPANKIPSITIGYGEYNFRYASYTAGFIGHNCDYLNLRSCDDIQQIVSPASTWGCNEGGSMSVIAAHSVGAIAIREMTIHQTVPDDPATPAQEEFQVHNHLPTIEVQHIDDLSIGNLREGVVWSGLLEYDASGALANDPTDDYASIGAVTIDCMSRYSDLYVQDFSLVDVSGRSYSNEYGDFYVPGDLFGEVHAPQVASSALIRIRDGLREYDLNLPTDAACECEPPDLVVNSGYQCYTVFEPEPPVIVPDDSPRYTTPAEVGAVRIAQAEGLHGQIIIDANNTTGQQRPDDYWEGDVIVGDDTATPIVLNSLQAQPYAAPLYDALPSELGGGAVGLVPFALHAAASHPENNDVDFVAPTLLNSEYNLVCPRDQMPLIATFYGPLTTLDIYNPPVGFDLLDPASTQSSRIVLADVSRRAKYYYVPVVNPRLLIVHKLTEFNNMDNPSGLYQLVSAPVPNLFCASLPLPCNSQSPGDCVPVAPLDYFFRILADCFNNQFGTEGPDCLADVPQGTCGSTALCDPTDFNNDGVFPDASDLFDFLAVFSGAPCPTGACSDIDFNNDGVYPDTTDLEVFLRVFSGGNC